jgi:hypothetical protein
VAPQAMVLRRAEVRPLDQGLCRFADLKTQMIARAQMNLPDKQELEAMLNSKLWKVFKLYRNLRFRVKHPLAQGIRKFRNLGKDPNEY